MAYVPPQPIATLQSDKTALQSQRAALKALIFPVPAGVNSRDIELMQTQVRRIDSLIALIDRRIKRAS